MSTATAQNASSASLVVTPADQAERARSASYHRYRARWGGQEERLQQGQGVGKRLSVPDGLIG